MKDSDVRSFLMNLYYGVKPAIPDRALLSLRRRHVAWVRGRNEHVWPIDERASRPPDGWTGWPEGKEFALILTHDVESAAGQARCRQLAELEMGLGFRSSFNFVAEDYPVDGDLQRFLVESGFEVAVHGLTHAGNPFASFRRFVGQAPRINHYLRTWGAQGFRSPSMFHNLHWIHLLDVRYDSSTFDTDPFEPQPDGAGTIFPFWVSNREAGHGYVEVPYTLPQDGTLFVLLGEKDDGVWRRKLEWIARHGGMALMITHPDYMRFGAAGAREARYPAAWYGEFLSFVKETYAGHYWHALPRDVAHYWTEHCSVRIAGV
jgi:hypothetical protein